MDFSHVKLAKWNRCCKYKTLLEFFFSLPSRKLCSSYPSRLWRGCLRKPGLSLLPESPSMAPAGTQGALVCITNTTRKSRQKQPTRTQKQNCPKPPLLHMTQSKLPDLSWQGGGQGHTGHLMKTWGNWVFKHAVSAVWLVFVQWKCLLSVVSRSFYNTKDRKKKAIEIHSINDTYHFPSSFLYPSGMYTSCSRINSLSKYWMLTLFWLLRKQQWKRQSPSSYGTNTLVGDRQLWNQIYNIMLGIYMLRRK